MQIFIKNSTPGNQLKNLRQIRTYLQNSDLNISELKHSILPNVAVTTFYIGILDILKSLDSNFLL